MPAVLILEAMAQATGILVMRTLDSLPTENSVYYFVGVDKARFRRPVEPGDQLILNIEILRTVRDIWKVKAEARVNDTVVADALIMGALREVDG